MGVSKQPSFPSLFFLVATFTFIHIALSIDMISTTTTSPISYGHNVSLRLELISVDTNHSLHYLDRLNKGIHRSSLRVQHIKHRILNFTHGNITRAKLDSTNGFVAHLIPGNGEFMTSSLAMGTPPLIATLLVDTGSDLIWRQCAPCINCYESHGTIFDPSRSSTFSHVMCNDGFCGDLMTSSGCSDNHYCTYTYTYADESFTRGELSYDVLTIPNYPYGNPHTIPHHIAFGCGHDNEGGGFGGADGLLGFGRGPLSLLSQLHLHRFSYCLQPYHSRSLPSPLFVGSRAPIPPTSHSTPLRFRPSSPSFYYVDLISISVGGQHLPLQRTSLSNGFIFDSGTTLTYLEESIYDVVVNAFSSRMPNANRIAGFNLGINLDLCYSKLPHNVPSLTFHFPGAKMNLPLENYFITIDGYVTCFAISPTNDISIFGNIQQQNFHILYDLQAERLSFAHMDCASI